MQILVAGATGFVGRHLVPALLREEHSVTCLARNPEKARPLLPKGVSVVRGDVLDEASLCAAMRGIDTAYYLVHSMDGDGYDFEERDRRAARTFARAAGASGVRRTVFLGGLGDDATRLSAHLRSRHEVGDLLRFGQASVTEVRAGLIIGAGSSSYQMLSQLVERLPVMITPRWVSTRTQPIAIDDVVRYLAAVLHDRPQAHATYEVGGPEVMTYREMMARYARWRGVRRLMVPVPVLTPRLSSYWVDLVTDVPASLARPLIEGLRSEMVVRDHTAEQRFGPPGLSFEPALDRARAEHARSEPPLFWLRRVPGHLAGVLGRRFWPPVLIDEQVRLSPHPPEDLWPGLIALGGRRGYPVARLLWMLRGLIDRIVGGPGLNAGGPSADEVRVGDSLDFWEVLELEPPRRLRLRSMMRMPGEAELEISVRPTENGAAIVQTARFRPTNLLGRIYWWALYPIHLVIFGGMANKLAQARPPQPQPAERHAG